MRILQLSSARHFGGGERHLVDLTNGLTRRGHELIVATVPNSPIRTELQDLPGENVFQLPFWKPLDLGSVWKLRKLSREREVDIVHAHMARDYPLAALIAGNTRPRLVLTRHVLFPMGRLHKLTRRRVARVIAVSEAVGVSLRAQKIFRDNQISVVRHGIDLSRFKSRARTAGSLRVGMLGELSPVKGQIDFVRAAAIISAQDSNAAFIIAGRDTSTNGQYGRELKQLIEATGLAARTEVIETRIDVPEFLSQLDVFVSASHSEAFGLAIVEAMAAGVPVVATASDGAAEIVRDGETGRLVGIGDVTSLANAIGELLRNASQRDRLARNAHAMVTENFSLDRMIAETAAVYRDVLRV